MQPRTFEIAFRAASMGQRSFSSLFTCHSTPRTFSIKRRFQSGTLGGDSVEQDVEVAVPVPVSRLIMSCAADEARSHDDAVLRAFPLNTASVSTLSCQFASAAAQLSWLWKIELPDVHGVQLAALQSAKPTSNNTGRTAGTEPTPSSDMQF